MNRTVLLALALTLAGCGDDESTTTPAPGPDARGTFSADAEPSGPAVSLRAVNVEPERIELEVVSHQLDEVYGIAFRIETSSTDLALESFAKAGGFWSSIDSGALSAAKQARPGLSVYAITARGQIAGAAAEDQVLGTVVLSRAARSDSGIGFVDGRSAVIDSRGIALPNVQWIGGQLDN